MASRNLFQQEMLYNMFSELQKNNGFYVKPYDLILGSLPNGIKDELSVTDSKMRQNTNEKILQASDVTGILTVWSETVDFAKVPIIKLIGIKPPDTKYGKVNVSGYFEFDDVYANRASITENNFVYNNSFSADTLFIAIPKNYTLQQAQDLLVGTSLTYQLENEVVEELQNKKYHDDKEYIMDSTTYEKIISYKFYVNGRVIINMLGKRTAEEVASIKISKNGIIEQEVTIDSVVGEYKSIGQFLDISKDDVLDIEMKTDRTLNGTVKLKDFKVYYDYSIPGDAYRLI